MSNFYHHIAQILNATCRQVVHCVNVEMVQSYWGIGPIIVEEEQMGQHRDEYGSNMLKYLAEKLRVDFAKGYNETNSKYFQQLYLTFQNRRALRDELSWTSSYRCKHKDQTVVKYLSLLKLIDSSPPNTYAIFLPRKSCVLNWNKSATSLNNIKN
jgi:hypothetical protein